MLLYHYLSNNFSLYLLYVLLRFFCIGYKFRLAAVFKCLFKIMILPVSENNQCSLPYKYIVLLF